MGMYLTHVIGPKGAMWNGKSAAYILRHFYGTSRRILIGVSRSTMLGDEHSTFFPKDRHVEDVTYIVAAHGSLFRGHGSL
jgi:hypothetical protein